MKQLNQTILLSGAIIFSMLSAPVFAAQSTITISSEVQELVQVMDEQGKLQQQAVAPTEIVPGDRVLFTTKFKNNGAEASDNVVITNPIPKHTRYLAGTAKGEHCIITFSIDGGKQWGDKTVLKVRQKDGEYRLATAADYTHIRWNYRRSLQPSEQKHITFETKLL